MLLNFTNISFLLIALLVPSCIARLSAWRRYQRGMATNKCGKPPALWSWDPLFHLDVVISNLKARTEHRVLKLDLENFKKYGQTLANPFFGRGAIQTTSIENLRTMMSVKGNGEFCVAREWAMKPMVGVGILCTDGSAWSHHRSRAKMMFSRAQINHPKSFGVHFERMMQLLPKDNSTVDLRPLFERMNMDAQSEFCFGESVGSLLPNNEEARAFMQHLHNAMFGISKRLFAGKLAWVIQSKSYYEGCKYVRAYISGLIDKALEREKDLDSDTTFRLLVYEFARQTATREELIDATFNLFMPGKDTPGTLLGHVLFACARNPGVWPRLRKEILANDIELSTLTLTKLLSLQYMQYVIYETARLYPVLDNILRTTNTSTTLPSGGGPDGKSPLYLLPNTAVIFNAYCSNRREDIYGEDAHIFRPERWEENPDLPRDFLFSLGPRVCPGSNLALFWVGYSLCGMAQRIESVENRDPIEEHIEDIALTHASLNGVKVGLKFA